jgi:drug/metabolite transporter (DMT)-like permease
MTTLTPRLIILLTLPPLLWAGNAVVGRLMVGQVPPLTLNFMRWALAAVLLLPLAWRVLLQWREVHARWPYLLLISVLGVGLYNALQYAALVTSTPLNITLVASSMPVWMLAVGTLFFGETATRRQLLGALLGLAGVVLVIARGSLHTLLAVALVPGDVMIVAAVIGWAFYSWLLVRPPASMRAPLRPSWDWAAMLRLQMLFGLFAAGSFAAGEQLLGAAPVQWSLGVAAALVYTALGASIGAYRCWGLGVAAGGPQLAAVFSNLTPLFAALLSALMLGSRPELYHAIAFALIVAGIAVTGPGRKAQ